MRWPLGSVRPASRKVDRLAEHIGTEHPAVAVGAVRRRIGAVRAADAEPDHALLDRPSASPTSWWTRPRSSPSATSWAESPPRTGSRRSSLGEPTAAGAEQSCAACPAAPGAGPTFDCTCATARSRCPLRRGGAAPAARLLDEDVHRPRLRAGAGCRAGGARLRADPARRRARRVPRRDRRRNRGAAPRTGRSSRRAGLERARAACP